MELPGPDRLPLGRAGSGTWALKEEKEGGADLDKLSIPFLFLSELVDV